MSVGARIVACLHATLQGGKTHRQIMLCARFDDNFGHAPLLVLWRCTQPKSEPEATPCHPSCNNHHLTMVCSRRSDPATTLVLHCATQVLKQQSPITSPQHEAIAPELAAPALLLGAQPD